VGAVDGPALQRHHTAAEASTESSVHAAWRWENIVDRRSEMNLLFLKLSRSYHRE
jgi:hypothetical protein